MGKGTTVIHGHEYFDSKLGVFIPPIYQTAIFEQPDRRTWSTRLSDRGVDLKYSREENPTVRCLERVLAKLELGDDALAFSSGMAAISATYLALLKRDARIILSKEAYGTTIQLAEELSKFGVKVTLAGPDTEDFIDKIHSYNDTTLVLVETMTNPTLRVPDVREIIKVCNEKEVKVIVDNTFATPIVYNPLVDGAYLVIHSLTKYISGHNDVIAGAVIGRNDIIKQSLWDWRRRLGSILDPHAAYLVLRGIKTLHIRFERQSKSALEIAKYLNDHSKVVEVYYPGLPSDPSHRIASKLFKEKLYGGVVSFKIKGGKHKVFKFMKSLKVIKCSPSLGGTESLITYPIISAAKTMKPSVREELGITENLLRLSVGLEDIEDLLLDLEKALSSI